MEPKFQLQMPFSIPQKNLDSPPKNSKLESHPQILRNPLGILGGFCCLTLDLLFNLGGKVESQEEKCVDLCSVALIIPSAPSKPHYTHFPMDLPVHFFSPWISWFLGSFGNVVLQLFMDNSDFLVLGRTLGALGIDSCRCLLGKTERLELNKEQLLLPKGWNLGKRRGFIHLQHVQHSHCLDELFPPFPTSCFPGNPAGDGMELTQNPSLSISELSIPPFPYKIPSEVWGEGVKATLGGL